MKAIGVLLAATLVPAGALKAQESRGPEQVAVRVLELIRPVSPLLAGRLVSAVDGSPVSEAEVSLAGLEIRTASDPAGLFRIEGARPGDYQLVVRAEGFFEERVLVRMEGARLTDVVVALWPRDPPLVWPDSAVLPEPGPS